MNESKIALTERLRREGRWAEASKLKDTALADFRDKGMKRDEAAEAAWAAMAEAYPPLPVVEAAAEPTADPAVVSVNSRLQGLSEIPAAWGDLPDNATLQTELAWVQSNRLRVVEERASGATMVHLDQARSPAPSWAALGWLETSIRSYAKFVDVLAKVMPNSDNQDATEKANVKRERMQLDEIRELLAEMHQD